MTNPECYALVKGLLHQVGVSCCGYTEAGKQLTIFNSEAQLCIVNDHTVAPQVGDFITKWCNK